MRRFLLAMGGAVVLIGTAVVVPRAAHACSGPTLSFDAATATARLVFAGTVISVPRHGAYELRVEEVFRGKVEEIVLIGRDDPSDTPATCSHPMEAGDRVVVAVTDPSDLGLFSSAVWYLLPDGTVGTLASEPPPAAGHEELFGILRVLPDTAMTALSPRSPLSLVGAALLLAASGIGARSLWAQCSCERPLALRRRGRRP